MHPVVVVVAIITVSRQQKWTHTEGTTLHHALLTLQTNVVVISTRRARVVREEVKARGGLLHKYLVTDCHAVNPINCPFGSDSQVH